MKFDISKDQLYDLYVVQKYSIYQISRMFNLSQSTIYRWLKKYNISTRSISEAEHLSRANHVNLSKGAIEWLNGELLGDGCLQSKSKYSACFTYTSKYKEYIKFISNTLDNFGIKQCGKIYKSIQNKYKGKIKQYKFKKPVISYHYASLFYEELYSLYKKWYPNGKKIVPKDIDYNNSVLWLHEYLSDGSLIHHKDSNPSIILYTMGFTVEDIEFLVNKLKELGFKSTRRPSNNTIRVSSYSTPDFLNYIGKCPVKCYKYKWNYKGRQTYVIDK